MIDEKDFEILDHIVEQRKDQYGLMSENAPGNAMYRAGELFKGASWRFTRNDKLPMEVRMYVALTHIYMHYHNRAVGKIMPTFEVYIAARLNDYANDPKEDALFPGDVAIELIKRYGIMKGLLQDGRTYSDISWASAYKSAEYLSVEETQKVIDKIKKAHYL